MNSIYMVNELPFCLYSFVCHIDTSYICIIYIYMVSLVPSLLFVTVIEAFISEIVSLFYFYFLSSTSFPFLFLLLFAHHLL